MNVHYGQINPPSFYEQDVEPTKKERLQELLKKANSKIDKILFSQSIVYNVIGGEMQREKDIERAGEVALRIENYIDNL